MQLWPFSRRPVLGVDVRTHEIRWLQLQLRKKEWVIEKFGIEPWQAPAFNSPAYGQSFKSVFSRLTKEHHFQANVMALALASKYVISRRVQTSESSPTLPDLGSNMALDWVKLASTSESKADFLVVAAKEEQVQGYIKIYQELKLDLKIIDIDCYALARAVLFAQHQIKSLANTVAIFDVNPFSLQFVVLHQEKIIFTHQWDIASPQDLKKYLPQCIELYHAANPIAYVEEIILCGGAELEELVSLLSAVFAIPANIINPFASMQINSNLDVNAVDNLYSRMLVSLGLALRKSPVW